jgi:hypothetical protein
MGTKTKKIIAVTATTIISIMIMAGAIAKLAGVKPAVDGLTRDGVGGYIKALSVFEIIFVALFIYPKTFKAGFILLCCYFGGAMATHLSHNEAMVQPAIPLTILCIAAFLRDKYIFLPRPGANQIV